MMQATKIFKSPICNSSQARVYKQIGRVTTPTPTFSILTQQYSLSPFYFSMPREGLDC